MKYLHYLATPYTCKNKNVPEEYKRVVMRHRAKNVTDIAVELLKQGIFTFSPISYNSPWDEAETYNLPHTWDFWKPFDLAFLDRCDSLIVFMQDGWKESVGVAAEIEFAEEKGLNIYYVNKEDIMSGKLKKELIKDALYKPE